MRWNLGGVRRDWGVVALALLLVVQSILLVWSAKTHSPSWDEPGHLAAGISHWQLGRFDLYSVNPPLVRMVAAAAVLAVDPPEMDWQLYDENPLYRSEVLIARRMIEINQQRSSSHFFIARLAVIPIALLGTIVCFFISRALFDNPSAVVAAALWAFSPTVLGYGSVITPDLASGVIAPILGFTIYRWFVTGKWPEAASMSVVMAIAMLIKSIWIFAPLAISVGWCAYLLGNRRQFRLNQAGHQVLQFAGAVFVSLFLVNAFYGFSGSFQQLGEFRFISTTLSGKEACEGCPGKEVGNRFEGTILAKIPVPLPRSYLLGIDIQRNDFEQGLSSDAWMSYLNGEWKQGGWWYYYFAGLFFNCTLGKRTLLPD